MKHGALLLLVATAPVAADDIYLKSGGKPVATDVMVVEESGGKVWYVDKSMKRRAWDAATVGRIERKRCDVHEFQERSDAAKDADAVVALADWAAGRKFRPEVVRELHERALGLDPDHEAANLFLGRVRHEGEWMTPEERDRRVREAGEEEMRAKGLVPWQGEWVTPEDKAKLEKGLRKHKGLWMTEDQIKEDEGFVKYEGKWVRKDEVEVLAVIEPVRQDSGLGSALKVRQTEHFAVLGDLDDSEMEALGQLMERLHAEWLRLFPSAKEGSLVAGKYRLIAFRKNTPYKQFVQSRYERQQKSEQWSEAYARLEKERMKLRQRETSFWEIQPHGMSCHVQMPDPFELMKAHCVHFAANVFATRHGHVRFPTWWLNESLAYFFEKRVSGTIETFNTSVGGGGYADAGPVEGDQKNPWIDHNRWQDLLLQMVRQGRDPALESFKGKELYGEKNRLATEELAKGFSIVTYLIQSDAAKFAAFFESTKEGQGSPVEREVAAVLKHYGSYRNIDDEWRKYALNGFRLAR